MKQRYFLLKQHQNRKERLMSDTKYVQQYQSYPLRDIYAQFPNKTTYRQETPAGVDNRNYQTYWKHYFLGTAKNLTSIRTFYAKPVVADSRQAYIQRTGTGSGSINMGRVQAQSLLQKMSALWSLFGKAQQ